MRKIIIIRSFIAVFWLGFYLAISFMEAPLKFSVPGISIADGLQIGRVVFSALNLCEWVFFLLLIISFFFEKPGVTVTYLVIFLFVVLSLETIWLLPKLDARAIQIINGKDLPPDSLHLYYIAAELLKIPLLFLIAWKGISENTTSENFSRKETVNVLHNS